MSDFFDIRKVIKAVPDAQYYMFHGERTGGKTYSALSYAMDRYTESGGVEQFVYVRRLSESTRQQYMRALFNGNVQTGDVASHMKKLGYEGIQFYSQAFWPLTVSEKGKLIRIDRPMGMTMSVNTWETAKGSNFPDVTTIIYDEYLTRSVYLPDEPILFENLVSSIVRQRSNVKVIMLGNTVSWSAPYYREWGLNHVREMKQGTWDVYEQPNGRKIVVCYTEHNSAKASDVYFTFDNTRSKMITEGSWETAEYRRIPDNLEGWSLGTPCYVWSIDGYTIRIDTAQTPDGLPVLLVRPSNKRLIENGMLDERFRDRIIYTDVIFPYANVKNAMTKHSDKYTKFLLSALKEGRVFYQNNTVGENLRNYLKWSTRFSPIPA